MCTFQGLFQYKNGFDNTGKIGNWDKQDYDLIQAVKREEEQKQYSLGVTKTMEMMYQKFRLDNPQLPRHFMQMDPKDPLYKRLVQLAVALMDEVDREVPIPLTFSVRRACKAIHDDAMLHYNRIQTTTGGWKFDADNPIYMWLKATKKKKLQKAAV